MLTQFSQHVATMPAIGNCAYENDTGARPQIARSEIWNLGPGIWNSKLGTCNLTPGTWSLEPGILHLELGTRNLQPGTWNRGINLVSF